MKHEKDLTRLLNLKSIIIGGRIPNYHKFADEMTPRQYVNQVTLHKIYDPVLSFQLLNGFTLMRINPNYLPDDKDSRKYATLMEWNNVDFHPKPKRYFKTSFPVRICVVQYKMKQILRLKSLPNKWSITQTWLRTQDQILLSFRKFLQLNSCRS